MGRKNHKKHRKPGLEETAEKLVPHVLQWRQLRRQLRAVEVTNAILTLGREVGAPWEVVRRALVEATEVDDTQHHVQELCGAIDEYGDPMDAVAEPDAAWRACTRTAGLWSDIVEKLRADIAELEEKWILGRLGDLGNRAKDLRPAPSEKAVAEQSPKAIRNGLAHDIHALLERLWEDVHQREDKVQDGRPTGTSWGVGESVSVDALVGSAAERVWLLIEESGLSPAPIGLLLGVEDYRLATSKVTAEEIIRNGLRKHASAKVFAPEVAGGLLGVTGRSIRNWKDGIDQSRPES